MAQRDLKVTLLGDDRTGAAYKSAGKGASGMVKALAAAGAAAGVAVGAFVAKGVKDAVELETSLREINTLFGLSGKAGADNFKEIQQVVKGVSSEVGIAQKTISEGLYSAISAGIPKENAFTFMQVAAKASIAGVTDVNTAVDGLTTVINAFGLDASQAQAVSDSLFTAVKGGKTTFSELSDSLFNVAPAAAAAGVSFQEVNAAIATLTAGGTPTSVATTQIRAALVGLQKPSKDLDAIFQKLGYTNAQTAIESKGLGFALDAVKTASGGNNGELQKLLGSTEAVSAANVLAGTGAAKFAQEIANQAGAAGATDLAFQEMEKSVGRSWERLKVSVQNAGIEIGQKILPLINDALQGFMGKADSSATAASRFGEDVRQSGEKLKAAAKFVIEHKDAILSLTAAVGTFMVGLKIATATTAAFNAVALIMGSTMTLALGPVGLIILAVAGLVAGLVVAYKTSETFRNIVDGVFNAVQKSAGNAVGFMIQGFKALLTVWLTVADGIVSGAAKALSWVPGLGDKLKAANTAFDNMKTGILATLDDAAQKSYGFGEKSGSNVAKGVAATKQQAFNAGAQVAADVGRGVGSGSGQASAAGFGVGANAGQGLINGINSKMIGIQNAARRAAIAAGQAMRAGLQERSPSKVTFKVGEFAGEGLRLGILDQVGAVSKAADVLAKSAIPNISGRDMADLAGMRVGGTGYVNSRLAATASTPTASGMPAPSQDRTAELIALLTEQNALLRAMPREYRMAERQGL